VTESTPLDEPGDLVGLLLIVTVCLVPVCIIFYLMAVR
jgi:hypothetical protein